LSLARFLLPLEVFNLSFAAGAEEAFDESAFAEGLLLVCGLGLHEEGLESIFDHVLGAVGEGVLAEVGPLVAVGKDELEDGLVFGRRPLSA
jgi:hypothetical protein